MGRILLTGSIAAILCGVLVFFAAGADSQKFIVMAFVAPFALLMLWITYRNIQYFGRLKAALKKPTVDCDVSILGQITHVSRRRRAGVFIEAVVDGQLWRGQMMGLNAEHKHIGNKGQGKAWICPNTGMPMQFLFEGKEFRPIPEIQRVNHDSFIEKHIVEKMKRDGSIVG